MVQGQFLTADQKSLNKHKTYACKCGQAISYTGRFLGTVVGRRVAPHRISW